MTTRHIESNEGILPYLDDNDPVKSAAARTLLTATRSWREAYGEIRLPNLENFLRRQAYEILQQVRQPSADEIKGLGEKGIQFFHIASPKSYAQVVAENQADFEREELKHANANPELRDYALPLAVEVGIIKPIPRFSEAFLSGSFGESPKTHLEMIEDYSQKLQVQFPDVRAIALPTIGYVLLDKAYQEESGDPLFESYYARALDAVVGRGGYVGQKMHATESYTRSRAKDDIVAAFPAIMFVGSK